MRDYLYSISGFSMSIMSLRWQFGIIAGIFLAIFTLYPQMKMLYLRGDDWQGHYAYNDIDEVAYGSYVRALIDGRPRKNDPYSGRDQSSATPQPESLFSIQFAAPYTIAIPARILGIGAPWAMTLAGAFAGFLAALAVFWLIGEITGNSWFALAASLTVFCFGALAAGEGAISEILFNGFSYPYFPGFRRYIPAMGFPAFFALCGFVWMMLRGSDQSSAVSGHIKVSFRRNPQLLYGVLSTVCFAYCVYTYFYIWTTAAAWLVCLTAVWLIARPLSLRSDLKALAGVGAAWVAVLVPYAYMLSNRSHSMDEVQLLVHTRMPDLTRFPEYISFAVLILLMIGIAAKIIEIKDRSTLFAFSLAMVPIAVFNQQIITGQSLQPIHYQVFIGNYVSLLALTVAVGILWKSKLNTNLPISKAVCLIISLLAVIWGFVECHYTVRVLDDVNIARDQALPVARRLEEFAKNDPDPNRTTVLSFDGIFADDMPTVAPQNVLWSRHQHVFAGLSWQESKERYYQYLYYSNVDEKTLDHLLKNDFVSMIALFGWGRHTDRLSSDAKPLTYGEIADETHKYAEYVKNFNVENAANPKISYVIIQNMSDTNLTNLDKWYQRDNGEVIGDFLLYRVKLR